MGFDLSNDGQFYGLLGIILLLILGMFGVAMVVFLCWWKNQAGTRYEKKHPAPLGSLCSCICAHTQHMNSANPFELLELENSTPNFLDGDEEEDGK